MNAVVDIAKQLNIKFLCSDIGITIIGPNESKFFYNASQNELDKAIKFIKSEANCELQTVLTGF